MVDFAQIPGIILGIIGNLKRIARKNNWKIKKHNGLLPNATLNPTSILKIIN